MQKKLLRHHLPRIFIATFFWFFWTKLFNLIETSYGRCTIKGFITKSTCLRAGHLWHGFDISGHAFILIHSSLVLIEEARPIIKWETIKEHLRNELHDRNTDEHSGSNPLRYLDAEQIRNLKFLYNRLTPVIRTLFIGMALLQLLWDVMLVGTMLYYHRMIEKVISGIIAVLTWYFTYRFWYRSNVLPSPAGAGTFLYQREQRDNFVPYKRSCSLSDRSGAPRPGTSNNGPSGSGVAPQPQQVPTFMGMPLYTKARFAGNTLGNQLEAN